MGPHDLWPTSFKVKDIRELSALQSIRSALMAVERHGQRPPNPASLKE